MVVTLALQSILHVKPVMTHMWIAATLSASAAYIMHHDLLSDVS